MRDWSETPTLDRGARRGAVRDDLDTVGRRRMTSGAAGRARLGDALYTATLTMSRMSIPLAVALLSIAGMAHADFMSEPSPYPGAPKRAPCDGDFIVCEGSGNKAALALNLARFRLVEVLIARKAQDARSCRAALQSIRSVRVGIEQLRVELRKGGKWRTDVLYALAQGDVLDEGHLFQLLEGIDHDLTSAAGHDCGEVIDPVAQEAARALRAVQTTTRPYPSMPMPRKYAASDEDIKRLDALYDGLAERSRTLLRQALHRPYRSRVGAAIVIAMTTVPQTLDAVPKSMRWVGLSDEKLRQIVLRHYDLIERERNRYLGLIKPELHEMMTMMQTLARADAQDCRELLRLMVKAPAANHTEQMDDQQYREMRRDCDLVLPQRCREATTLEAIDSCDASRGTALDQAPAPDALYREGTALVTPYIELADRRRAPIDSAKLERGLDLLEQVVKIKASNWSAFWILGMGYRAKKDWQRSYERLARAYALKPDSADVGREYGAACMFLGRGDEGVRVASNALKARPADAGLQANLAVALLIAGRVDEALAEARSAQKRDPGDQVTRALVEEIELVRSGKKRAPHNLRELEQRESNPAAGSPER